MIQLYLQTAVLQHFCIATLAVTHSNADTCSAPLLVLFPAPVQLLLCPTVQNGCLVQAVGIIPALAAAGRAEGPGADSQPGGALRDASACLLPLLHMVPSSAPLPPPLLLPPPPPPLLLLLLLPPPPPLLLLLLASPLSLAQIGVVAADKAWIPATAASAVQMQVRHLVIQVWHQMLISDM